MKRFLALLLPLVLFGALLGWVFSLRASWMSTQESTPPAHGVILTATIAPVAALLQAVGEGRVTVYCLMRPGDSPHTVEPTPQAAARTAKSLALVSISPSLEGWAASMDAPAHVTLLPMLPEAFRRGDDPHFWLDPLAVAAVAEPLAQALSRLDPPGASTYQANARRYQARLHALHAELVQTLAPVRGRGLVLAHPGMHYFLRRYGIPCMGVVERSPGAEPSPRDLATLRQQLAHTPTPVLLASLGLAPQAAQATARALAARLAFVDELGATPERQTLDGLLRFNARVITEALAP